MTPRVSALLALSLLTACGARTNLLVSDAAVTTELDASPLDLGRGDASRVDLGLVDAGPRDFGTPGDASPPDFGPLDFGIPDGGRPDFGIDLGADLGPPDLGLDAGPPASLRGLRAELPCTGPVGSGGLCPTPATAMDSAVLMGTPGTSYDVAFRIRGVTEGRRYTCVTSMGSWCESTTTPSRGDNYNVWGFSIGSPAQQYYLNSGPEAPESFVLDDVHVVRVAAGATVTLLGDAINSAEFPNRDASGVPVVVPGIPPAPTAFDGEFVQVDVLSITPAP